jgi:hypothetical protein
VLPVLELQCQPIKATKEQTDDEEEAVVLTPSLLAQLLSGRDHLTALSEKKSKKSKKGLPEQLAAIWQEGAVLTCNPFEIVKIVRRRYAARCGPAHGGMVACRQRTSTLYGR